MSAIEINFKQKIRRQQTVVRRCHLLTSDFAFNPAAAISSFIILRATSSHLRSVRLRCRVLPRAQQRFFRNSSAHPYRRPHPPNEAHSNAGTWVHTQIAYPPLHDALIAVPSFDHRPYTFRSKFSWLFLCTNGPFGTVHNDRLMGSGEARETGRARADAAWVAKWEKRARSSGW